MNMAFAVSIPELTQLRAGMWLSRGLFFALHPTHHSAGDAAIHRLPPPSNGDNRFWRAGVLSWVPAPGFWLGDASRRRFIRPLAALR
jgi:hypothetical protein